MRELEKERNESEEKMKTLSRLVEGLVQEIKEIRQSKFSEVEKESGEGMLISKQGPSISTKNISALTPYTQNLPTPVLNICSLPRPLSVTQSSLSPLMILTKILSLHVFLTLAHPNTFLEMSTGRRPPPEPPPPTITLL